MRRSVLAVVLFALVSALTPAGGRADPTDGLVASYPLNGTASDASGNANNGIVYGAAPAADRYGVAGGALRFDGVDDYVEIPASPGLDTQYSISIFAWISAEGVAGPIVNYRTTDYYGVHLWVTADCGPLCLWARFVSRDGGFTAPVYGPLGLTSDWRFVGCTYDYQTGIARLWCDGQCVSSAYVGVTTLGTQYPIRMGRVTSDGRVFRGRIDDVRIYNRALDENEIRQLYGHTEILIRDDRTLTPLEGARLTIFADGRAAFEAITDAGGECWVPPLPPGPYYTARASYDTHSSPTIEYVCADACDDHLIIGITGAAGVEVTGVVYDDFTGAPLEGATVELSDPGSSFTVSGQTTALQSLSGGVYCNYRLSVPAPGQYRLRAVKRGSLGSRYAHDVQDLYAASETIIDTGADNPSNGHHAALTTKVVMLLHGVLSSHAMWDDATVDSLHGAGWAVFDGIDMAGRLVHPDLSLSFGNADVSTQAADVWQRARNIGVWSFNVIAHSQGGVVARYLNERGLGQPVIPKLIELASPNHGSPLGSLHEVWKLLLLNNLGTIPSEVQQMGGLQLTAWVLENALAVSDLAPDSPLMKTLNHQPGWFDLPPYDWSGFCFDTPNGEDHLRPETRYLSIHGTSPLGDPALEFAGLQFALFSGCTTNDGAVAQQSAILWNAGHGNVINKSVSLSHFQIANAPEVVGCCIEALARDDCDCGGQEAKSSALAGDAAWGLLAERSTLLPAEAAIGDSVAVSAADSLMVAWSWYAGAPTVSLVAPDGAVIDSLSAAERPDARLVTGPTFGYYVITAPAAGTWRWTIAARGADAAQAVDTRILLANGPRIDLRERPGAGGLDRILEARLESADGLPLTDAAVVARLESPESGANESAMLDDGTGFDLQAGDGVYTCAIALAGYNETTTARVRATASVDGQGVSLNRDLCLRAPASTDVACAIASLDGQSRLVGAPITLEGSVANEGQEGVTVFVTAYREPGWSVVGEDTLSIGAGGVAAVSFTDVPLIEGVLRYSLTAQVGSAGQTDADISDNRASADIVIGPAITAVVDGGDANDNGAGDGPASTAAADIHTAPNPANGRVVITLRGASLRQTDSQLVIYDLRGRRIRELRLGPDGQDDARAEWDFRDDGGQRVASGVYFARVRLGDRVLLKKLAFIE